jgi:lipoate-protein ligase B
MMGDKSDPTWCLLDLGLVDYQKAWDLQLALVSGRHRGEIDRDLVLMLEHPAVFTLGRRGGREHLLIPEEKLEHAGIPIVQVERGGKITYHGPGQLVAYPILNLARLKIGVADYVTALEEVMIQTCAGWGITVDRNEANRGVWVGRKKIGSIGIAVRRDICFHGMALNVDPDLDPFCWVDPCGLEGVSMTSMQQELDKPVGVQKVKRSVTAAFAAVFNVRLQPCDPADMNVSGVDIDEFQTRVTQTPLA